MEVINFWELKGKYKFSKKMTQIKKEKIANIKWQSIYIIRTPQDQKIEQSKYLKK